MTFFVFGTERWCITSDRLEIDMLRTIGKDLLSCLSKAPERIWKRLQEGVKEKVGIQVISDVLYISFRKGNGNIFSAYITGPFFLLCYFFFKQCAYTCTWLLCPKWVQTFVLSAIQGVGSELEFSHNHILAHTVNLFFNYTSLQLIYLYPN